ncbi:MAG: hypothetical protein ABFC77_11815 [Thermoguttaceae bacterium]
MKRRGATLFELMVAGTLLAALAVVCLQMTSAIAAQRRAADLRQLAIAELSNAMERFAAKPWAELTVEAAPQLSAQAAKRLLGAELKFEVSDSKSPKPQARRIKASLRWQDAAGQFVAPITLVTWRYAH